MIRKRNNENKISEIENKIEYVDKPIPKTGPTSRFKTYKEEAIYVLNILEKEKGVNIYDENRYGGMYLKDNKSNIKEIFSDNSNKNNNEIPNNELMEFFKN